MPQENPPARILAFRVPCVPPANPRSSSPPQLPGDSLAAGIALLRELHGLRPMAVETVNNIVRSCIGAIHQRGGSR